MFFTKTICVIVDAYATGKYLAPAFRNRGYPCIHIKSSARLPAKFKHNDSDFILSLTYEGHLDSLVEKLNVFQIKLCVPGYESGVELADLLSEKLDLPSNGSQYSKARRDKHTMMETVAQANIKTTKQLKSSDLSNLLQWTKALNSVPVVLKPLDSANGDGVFFCYNEQEISAAFEKILQSENQFGCKNTTVLAESLNAGQEYIINTVSWQGQHYVAEMWHITRKPNSLIYDKAEIVHETEAEWQPIVAYTQKVLDALRIQYGAGTTEVKYTPEQGPVLLETSARLMAGAPLSFSQELAGFTQLSLLVEAYLDSSNFLQRLNRPRPSLTKQGMGVILISDCQGILQSDINTRELQQLQTLHSYTIEGEAGCSIAKTVDSLTAPGEIYLIADNKEALEHDYQQIRLLETRGLYRDAVRPRYSLQTLFQPQPTATHAAQILTSNTQEEEQESVSDLTL